MSRKGNGHAADEGGNRVTGAFMQGKVFSGRRHVKTFADLRHSAVSLMRIAQEYELGSKHTTLASFVMWGFTLEAYCNHLGEGEIALWQSEDRLSIWKKLERLAEALQIQMDYAVAPYRVIPELIKFRNTLAHGRSTDLVGSAVYGTESTHALQTEWESFNTMANLERVRRDIEAVIIEMNVAAGLGDYPWVSGFAVGSISDGA
jgi:hypothetical protein